MDFYKFLRTIINVRLHFDNGIGDINMQMRIYIMRGYSKCIIEHQVFLLFFWSVLILLFKSTKIKEEGQEQQSSAS